MFVVAFGLGLSAYFGGVSPWWMALPAVAFTALLVVHERTARERLRVSRIAAFQERGLARVEDRWAGLGPDGSRFADPDHPFAADLDLFGRGSLFQRITTASSRGGEAVLASWLLSPAAPETIRRRQEAVAELTDQLDFRDDLARLGERVPGVAEFASLAEWGVRPVAQGLGVMSAAASVLSLASVALGAAWIAGIWSIWPFLIAVGVLAGFARLATERLGPVLQGVDRRADELSSLKSALALIESKEFRAEDLSRIRGTLRVGEVPASRRIAGLLRRADLLEWRNNLFFAPIAAILLWNVQVAVLLERWRRRSGREIAGWVAALSELEALASLAAFAFENPDHAVPEIVEDGPRFEAQGLGHPLLPRSSCVRNDVELGGDLRVLVVSGSNMSGKSTLLRSVGTNVVLALAGGGVRSVRMRLSPLAIGATLRIQDSLQEGKSRFYAEILRLKLVVGLTHGSMPVLFLLDEILHGTNSHDRVEGASAIVRGLIDRGAIGLVTTHDLALAEVAEGLAPRAANVHFEDRMEDGVMEFDYTMRPGVVRNSNALALMRAVGLDV